MNPLNHFRKITILRFVLLGLLYFGALFLICYTALAQTHRGAPQQGASNDADRVSSATQNPDLIPYGDGDNDREPQGKKTLEDWLQTQGWWWMLKERSSPLAVPLDWSTLSRRYAKAAAQMDRLQTAKIGPEQGPQPQPPSSWVNIGPAHIVSSCCGWATENSGRTVALAVDPVNSSHWLITADTGGIWQTTDGGGTWSPRTDDQPALRLNSENAAIAFAPPNGIINPNIVYASGANLLKSTDNGNTWKVREKTLFGGHGAHAFLISPTDPNVVVAAVDTLFGSDASYGIYRTTDGGTTWTQKLPHSASDLVSVAGNFSKQYAAIGELGYASNGLYRSTDSGQNWQRIAGPWDTHGDRISLALAPSDSSVLYVAVEDINNFSQPLGFWKSSNAWDPTPTWTLLTTPSYSINFGRPLSVDPANSSNLYTGGNLLYKSTNGGVTWTNITGCPPNGTHWDFWALQWIGGDFVVTNDGGVFRTSDKGATYQSKNGDLPIAQFYRGAIHPTSTNLALGGTQDNASPIYHGNRVWQMVCTGDGQSSAISVLQPDSQWIVSGQNMDIRHTTNGGASWSGIAGSISPNCHQFRTRFTNCGTGDVVITGTCSTIWRSVNAFSAAQPTWTSNSPNLGTDPEGMAFAPSDASCGTYAIGGGSGKIWATTNSGGTWSQIGPVNLPSRVVTSLAFDPQNSQKLYATLSGFDEDTPGHPGHVFVCSNIANPTWVNISPSLDAPHDAIAIDPRTNSDVHDLYVGTDLGMVISTDSGTTWAGVPSNQIPKVVINDIKINRTTNQVVAFTYGRSAYSGNLPAAGSPGGAINWHRERQNAQSEVPKLLLRQPWWLGLGILGTVAVAQSFILRSRSRKRKG
jgi:photosystem II stability/assembly factor-like uncharacterized protein